MVISTVHAIWRWSHAYFWKITTLLYIITVYACVIVAHAYKMLAIYGAILWFHSCFKYKLHYTGSDCHFELHLAWSKHQKYLPFNVDILFCSFRFCNVQICRAMQIWFQSFFPKLQQLWVIHKLIYHAECYWFPYWLNGLAMH